MGFFDLFDTKKTYDRWDLTEFWKQEITGHTSLVHPKITTNIHKLIMEQVQKFEPKTKTFRLQTCNTTFDDFGNGVFKLVFACILSPYDAYDDSLSSCHLDVSIETNKYAELVNTEKAVVKVTR